MKDFYGYKVIKYLFFRFSRGAVFYGKKFAKWIAVSAFVGAVCGFVGFAFYAVVKYSTELRIHHSWLLYLLPAAGLLIACLYRITGMEGKGTNDIIDSIHNGDKIPLWLVPVIFISTALTHLCGGSAGREGAALQIGGGIGCKIGRLIRLDEKDMRLITMCGMSAVFAALFGTPLTATVFALEVISVGVLYYAALLPCMTASLTAYGISRMLGMSPVRFAVAQQLVSLPLLIKVGVLSIICAAVSIFFCETMHHTAKWSAKLIPNPFLRGIVGGGLILGLTLILQTTAYNGTGDRIIALAIEGCTAPTWGFFWKIVFTAISLGFGFKGGEIVPSFFIGACLGCVAGPILGIPAGFAAAIGLIAMFCGSFNCPVASIILSIELFGSIGIIYFALAAGISYMLSGYFGIYESQKILYSKVRAEFINQKVK